MHNLNGRQIQTLHLVMLVLFTGLHVADVVAICHRHVSLLMHRDFLPGIARRQHGNRRSNTMHHISSPLHRATTDTDIGMAGHQKNADCGDASAFSQLTLD